MRTSKVLALLLALLMLPGWALAQDEGITKVQLSFAGDCTLGGHEGWMNYSIGTFRVMQQEVGNYTYFLEKVQDIFAQDDCTIVNLEVVLADSPRGLNKDRKWNFRGTTDYVNILTQGSVEAVTLGNNHSRDFGQPGFDSTRQTLTEAGVGYCVDQEVFFFEKDGVRIAFLGFWETNFRKHKKWMTTEIPRLKAEENCAAVVILYHGGREYTPKHSKTQQEDMRWAIDAGADLVVGHHPHVLQGMEIYKNRQIFYSLGDFCYGGNRKPREIEYPTIVLGVELAFDKDGLLYQQATIHPARISATSPRNNYQPYLVTGELAQDVMQRLQNDTPHELAPYVEGEGAVQPRVYTKN